MACAGCPNFALGRQRQNTKYAQSEIDWAATFPNAWEYERFDAMAKAIETDGIVGRHITDMEPACDTYEFSSILRVGRFSEKSAFGQMVLY